MFKNLNPSPHPMSNNETNEEEIENVELVEIEDNDLSINNERIVFRTKKVRPETYGQTPAEDKHGRPKTIVTRLCWCSSSAPGHESCTFHSPRESGWEVCPHRPTFDTDKTPPRKLWAPNPRFGLDLNEEEVEAKLTKATERLTASEQAEKSVDIFDTEA